MEYLLVYHICYSVWGVLLAHAFNPFMDHDLHSIDWVGSNELEKIVVRIVLGCFKLQRTDCHFIY